MTKSQKHKPNSTAGKMMRDANRLTYAGIDPAKQERELEKKDEVKPLDFN